MKNDIIYESPNILITKNIVKMKVSLPSDLPGKHKTTKETYSVVNIIGVSVIREPINEILSTLLKYILFYLFLSVLVLKK